MLKVVQSLDLRQNEQTTEVLARNKLQFIACPSNPTEIAVHSLSINPTDYLNNKLFIGPTNKNGGSYEENRK
jgi:hypothetical protein